MSRLLITLVLVGCDPTPAPPRLDPSTAGPVGAIRLVGASAATPLVTRLARAFLARSPGSPLLVDAPLSPEGAAAALADGVVDATVVMGPAAGAPANATLLARTLPMLAVGPGVPLRRISAADLARRLADPEPRWPDGHPLRFLLRPAGDPLQRAVAALHPDLDAAISAAVAARRFRMVPSDAELREALRTTPGAIAVADVGGVRMHATPLWRMRLSEGRPAAVEIWLVTRDPTPERLRVFIAFATGSQGRAIVGDLGYGLP